MKIRINKFLADCGISSRRKSEDLIKEGRVSVNDKIITDFNFRIEPASDFVTLDGERIKPKKNLYYMLNKPKGIITSATDDRNRKTVMDLLNVKERLYPVGRLDYDTTGLLFLTNDGEFSQLLTHPRNKVPRVYEVKLDSDLKEEDKERLIKGVSLDSKIGKFLRIIYPSQKNKKLIKIVCEEGRNRFVKRMVGKLGYNVKSLSRVSFAGIKLDVPIGKYRKLTQGELQLIKEKYSN
jgi:23S rRNA pseudouridine2605 synthase